MPPLVSILVTLFVIIIALKIALKVTGCLVRIIIFAAALWFIVIVLNSSFSFLTFLP